MSLSKFASSLAGLMKIPREYVKKIEQKEQNHAELCIILGKENGDRIYDIIKSEKHLYDVDGETGRTANIKELALYGISFDDIKDFVEKDSDSQAAYMIQCPYLILFQPRPEVEHGTLRLAGKEGQYEIN
jgi:hypothetical protein